MPAVFDVKNNQVNFGGASIYHTTTDSFIIAAKADHLIDKTLLDSNKPVPHVTGIQLKVPAGGYTAQDLTAISDLVTQVDKYVERAAAPRAGRQH
jgi:hypothetical protein